MSDVMQPMVSMLRDEDDAYDARLTDPSDSDYPCGLCVTLTGMELGKLGMQARDFVVGETIHMHSLATIKSMSESATGCCVTLQIEKMCIESEDAENAAY
jgi:hypothetical protein